MKKASQNMLDVRVRPFVCVAIALALSACSSTDRKDPQQAQASQGSAPTNPSEPSDSHTTKPSAPVAIKASLSGGSAAIELELGADASDVSVDVWGTGGLVVTSSATPIQGRTFARGEKVPLAVSFTAPETRSDLAVRVRGTFGGKERSVVRSFSLHAEAGTQGSAGSEVRVGPDGEPVRVMKAQ